MFADIFKWIVVAVIALLVGLAVLNRFGFGKAELSKDEVIRIIQALLDDSAHEWALDDFTTVDIRDPELDEIRKQVAEIADRYENWEPKYAFPPDAKPELRAILNKLI
jgi:hypothetical protein